MTTPDERARYVDGLRVLASALEAHPEIPLPTQGRLLPMSMTFLGESSSDREDMAAAARAIPCAWKKNVRESAEYGDYFDLCGQVAGLAVQLTTFRDTVCKRVVTGTREVTEEVPDPAAPKVTVTRVVEDIEWDCGSLFSPLPAGAPKAVSTS